MNKILLALSLFLAFSCYGKCTDRPIVIAVVDTGFGYEGRGVGARLCKYGHKDFTIDQKYSNFPGVFAPVPFDFHSHGTNIVGIIESYVRPAHINYCILVLKFYAHTDGSKNGMATVEAFLYANRVKADYINYSGGGLDANEFERLAVAQYLDVGGQMIVAAGNNNHDLTNGGYYPACYDKRLTVVGSLTEKGKKAEMSNYGAPVNRWEIGQNVIGYGIKNSGTSQATAVATGKIVSQSTNKCDIGK
jgi:hypothetical protein